MPLNYQAIQVPFVAGLDGGTDKRALQVPALAVCRDVEFDEIGGLQTRKPFAAMGGAITDGRKLVAYGDELLLFTKDTLYTWNASAGAWISRGTYLAPLVTEQTVFQRTSQQTECDRAELNGVVVYAWADATATTSVYVAAIDKATSAVLLAPAVVKSGTKRPRLLVMGSQILLFFVTSATPDLEVVALDPANLATSLAAAKTVIATGTDFDLFYDVATDGTVAMVVHRRNTATAYSIHKVFANLTSTATTKARTCDGPIAVSISPDGFAQVIRANGAAIQGDLVNVSTLADVFTAQAIGTASNTSVWQIAAAHRSVQDGGYYRCYVWWSAEQDPATGVSFTGSNWVSTGNTLGGAVALDEWLGVASRAFDRGGQVFVWTVFAGVSDTGAQGFRAQLQNTYILYRDDMLPVAKASSFVAGGFPPGIGCLPNVQSLGNDEYAWAGCSRRIIPLGAKHFGYDASAPQDIAVRFDADEARRCVRLGETLYIAGGQIMQYDGQGLAEVGFHVYPWNLGGADGGGGGAKAAGTFAYKATWAWPNAKGELDRSTTATVVEIGPLSASHSVIFSMAALYPTLKTGPRGEVAVELWGTVKDAPVGAPFYLLTSKDPSALGSANDYLPNAPGTVLNFEDNLADAATQINETNPENGGILENLAPSPASIVAANQNRIFLAGVSSSPNRISYSKLRGDGEVAAFHDALIIDLPPEGGGITAIAFLDETLVVFKETATYALPGDGFDNAGGGQNYGPARRISADVGAESAEAVALTPAGLMFKSAKGWQLLGHDFSVQYIGQRVRQFDDENCLSIHVVETQHQVRCVTAARILVFDYKVGQFVEWTEVGARGAVLWQGQYLYLTTTGVMAQQDSFAALTYGLDVETAWLKPSDLQGYGAVRWLSVLGEFRSAHRLRVRIAYNYADSDGSGPAWLDDKYFTATPAVVGGPLQFRHGPKFHKCESFKVRLTAYDASLSAPPTGEALKLTGMSLEIGLKRGLFKGLPSAQKQ